MTMTVSVRRALLIAKSESFLARYLWYLESCKHFCHQRIGQRSSYLQKNEDCYPFIVERLVTRLWAHCQHDIFTGKKWSEFSTPPYHASFRQLSIGSSCSRTCCCYWIWSTRRLYLVPGTSTLLVLSSAIYIRPCDSVTFQYLQNARYMPSAEPADSGRCPSDNLSRRAGFPMKNQ